MQPQHPALIRITPDSPWQEAKGVHRCRDGRWLAGLHDGTAVYVSDVRLSAEDVPDFMMTAYEDAKQISLSLDVVPVDSRCRLYYEARADLFRAFGRLKEAAQQMQEVAA